ncbi:hypothetical protein D9758_006367 [Tetrapyrgos nigripes]|uniref:Uncharacterized protein n=1 Tax=Tetrapyrgos nigripes TaxID=182062 RepID=A0A8H5D942_9AGAR|nr:hypothetical protein D9758_006367 [Tetrapyrgos nigripes]
MLSAQAVNYVRIGKSGLKVSAPILHVLVGSYLSVFVLIKVTVQTGRCNEYGFAKITCSAGLGFTLTASPRSASYQEVPNTSLILAKCHHLVHKDVGFTASNTPELSNTHDYVN